MAPGISSRSTKTTLSSSAATSISSKNESRRSLPSSSSLLPPMDSDFKVSEAFLKQISARAFKSATELQSVNTGTFGTRYMQSTAKMIEAAVHVVAKELVSVFAKRESERFKQLNSSTVEIQNGESNSTVEWNNALKESVLFLKIIIIIYEKNFNFKLSNK